MLGWILMMEIDTEKEIQNKEQHLSECSVNTFSLLPWWYQINALGPLRWDREEGTRLFMMMTDDSCAYGRMNFIFSASLFFAVFFLWEYGFLGRLWVFSYEQNTFLIKCFCLWNRVKGKNDIVLRSFYLPGSRLSTVYFVYFSKEYMLLTSIEPWD